MIRHLSKRVLYYILYSEIFILAGAFIFYLLSSEDTLRYIIDQATASTKISYRNINGNLLEKIKIEGLKYDNNLIADEVLVDWSFRSILSDKIVINDVELENIDINNIKKLTQNLSTKKETNSTKGGFSTPPIKISKLHTSLLPYRDEYVTLSSANVDCRDIEVNKDGIGIKNFSIETSSNYSEHLTIDGSFINRELKVDNLNIENLDIQEIIKLTSKLPKSDKKEPLKLPINSLVLKDSHITAKEFDINSTNISKLELNTKDIEFNFLDNRLDADKLLVELNSNILNSSINSKIIDNRLQADSKISLNPNYFSKKVKIVDFESLNPISLNLDGNLSNIDGIVKLQSKNIFKNRFKKKNVTINKLISKFSYDIKSRHLQAITDANLSEKYAQSIILHDKLTYDKTLKYGGTIEIPKIREFPKYTLPLFEKGKIVYDANLTHLDANLTTTKLKLNYKMQNYKKADFYLTTPRDINLSELFSLPKDINSTKAKVSAFMHLDFKRPKVLIDTNVTSNLMDLSGVIDFKNGFHTKAKATLPKGGSILSKIDKKLKLDKIFPSIVEINYKNSKLHITDKNDYFSTNYLYNTKTTTTNSSFDLDGNSIFLKGDKKLLHLSSRISSLENLQKGLAKVYEFKPMKVKGEVDINGTIKNLATSDISLHSKWITYEYAPYKLFVAQKIKMDLNYDANKTTIKNFSFNTFLDRDRRFYSNKSATIYHKDKKIIVENLVLNDEINIDGEYDKNSSNGKFNLKATNYHYNEKDADIYLDADIIYTIKKDKSDLDGKIVLRDGVIRYKYRNTHSIDDPDIIFVQEEEKKKAQEEARKESKLAISIAITSKKDILYKTDSVKVKFVPDFSIWKEKKKELEFLGRIILKGGEYAQGTKEFTILPSELIFGGEIINPYLNIKASYQGDPYKIHIDIAGRVDSPIVNFSSDPYLSQSDILSMLLFDSTATDLFEGTTNSSNQAITLFGNTFAKEIVQNFGIKLDKLVILSNAEGGFGVEVGKKISKKVTIIYTNDIVQSLKIRYHHSDKFETDIMISPESSGIDFIYKREH